MTPQDSPRKITASEARSLLPRLEDSGLAVAKFAREEGIDSAALYNARRQARVASLESSRARFVQLGVKDAPRGAAAPSDTIVVELPNHCVLRVQPGVDSDDLRRVVEVLRAC